MWGYTQDGWGAGGQCPASPWVLGCEEHVLPPSLHLFASETVSAAAFHPKCGWSRSEMRQGQRQANWGQTPATKL